MAVEAIVWEAGEVPMKVVHLVASEDPVKIWHKAAAICRAKMSRLVPGT
ncbi:MAG: hypothetical protein P8J29_10225 [Rhodospirillales bacterium]|nr:hypothetical protein [Rhodospirillales bacterium]